MAVRFGLDVGRGSVKLVRVDRKGGVTGAECELDPALDGPARRAALLDGLRGLLRELGVRARDEVHVAVPRAEAIVKVLAVPALKDDELERVVRLQALRDIPFDLAEVVLAWGRLGPPADPAKGGEEVIVAAVRRGALEEVQALVAEAGATPGTVEVSTQAAARALARIGPQGAGEVVLVEVGRATTDIIVLERTVDAAGNAGPARLAWSRSASVGCGPRTDRKAEGETAPWLDRLGHEVARSLVAARAARGLPRTGPPDALLVAGGGAAVEALAGVLEARVGLKPVILDGLAGGAPGATSGAAAPEHDPRRGARFVVARGLAEQPVAGVPLLDLADRARDLRAASTRRRALVVGAIVAVVTAGVGLLAQNKIDARAEAKARLEEERRTLAPLVSRARGIQAELTAARRWEERRGRELEVLLAVARSLPPDQAYLTNLRWSDGKSVSLTGRARDIDEVGRYISALELDPLVHRARLDNIIGNRNQNARDPEPGVDFTAIIELREPASTSPASGAP